MQIAQKFRQADEEYKGEQKKEKPQGPHKKEKEKSFVQKLGDAPHKGKTVVKTTFLEANKKVQAAIKTIIEYKWIPGTGKAYAIPGGGSVRDAGSLKDVYQFMKDTGEKVKNWIGGEGAADVGKMVHDLKVKQLGRMVRLKELMLKILLREKDLVKFITMSLIIQNGILILKKSNFIIRKPVNYVDKN
ncbi:hypothetical protein [Bacillus cereus group sp. BfR-BA-01380]|uniref:hypothetical protein n=1 Tax=Bacillus cereus group sp. BfR-BA-01380 TaxID=2920324 RepID=UPI001F5A7D84|nr:hypothetical protein [Bacillus cereus group sp. BfR-BA-01380]